MPNPKTLETFRHQGWSTRFRFLRRSLGLSCLVPLILFSAVAPGAAASTEPAVHNSRLVYSAEEMLGFDLKEFLERSAPHLASHRETISHLSAYSSISPRIALALMELRGRAVRGPLPEPLRPFGDLVPQTGFSRQLRSGLGLLAAHFYEYRRPGPEDPLAGYPDFRAAEAATVALLGVLDSTDELQRFLATYAELFPGEAPLWQAAPGALLYPKATVPPASLLQLPYGVGHSWIPTGTHSYRGDEVGPKSSIDFARNWPPWGANTSNDWIVAANSGTAVVHSSCYLEVVSASGWSTSYYHLDNIIVATGQSIARNQRLANYANHVTQALCSGGHSIGPHVHFSLRRSGQITSLDGVSLSRYVVHAGRFDYDSDCDFFWLARDGVKRCAWVPLTNPGVAATPATPSGLAAAGLSASEVELTWSDNSTDETYFEIQRLYGSYHTVATVGANITRHVSSGLASGTSYTYRLRARNGAGASAWAGPATATTRGEAAPSGLGARALSASEIELEWNDNSASESGFEIDARSAGSFEPVMAVPAATTSAVVSDLDSQTTYTFRLRATGGLGDSTYSNETSATTFQADPEPCVEGPGTMCLNAGRFKVEVIWRDYVGDTGEAQVVPFGSADSGLVWFFDAANWEMLIKVLDGCGINDRFWVFAAASTDVEYTLRVTDSYTGLARTYLNTLGTASPAITDTDAFATCQAIAPFPTAALPPAAEQVRAP